MAADGVDGDRVIEMVSAGTLYRGDEWERKYWSCSRGKDRYPYPVGYHAIRHFSGISYTMEIQQGPRGPIFQVTSSEGDSSTGHNPDMAWKNLQKTAGAKIRNWQKKGTFPQKIDGVELFGFKSASIQRLLRELLVDSTGAAELKLPCPIIPSAASQLTHDVAVYVSDDHERDNHGKQLVRLDKTVGNAKRTMNPNQEEATTKRVHYQDILTSVDKYNDELDKSAHQSSNKGGLGSRVQLSEVSGSRRIPLLEEIPCDSRRALIHDNLGECAPNSSQEDGLSSGSYLSSEMSDLEAAAHEVAKSMMSLLLPQAIPLLKKSHRKMKVKQKRKQKDTVSMRTASAQNLSIDGCQGVTMPTSIGEGTNKDTSQTHAHEKPLCYFSRRKSAKLASRYIETVEHISAKDDCTNDGQGSKSDETNAVVADSFEDDAQICCDNTSKPMRAHHHESDDASSREPIDNSKLLHSKKENHAQCSELQVAVHESTNTPDVVYDNAKGQYILSDSLLACLEEEFGEKDNFHRANYKQGNSDAELSQVKQLFKAPTKRTNKESPISMDGSDHKDFGSTIIDGSAKVLSARHGQAISSDRECSGNVLQGPFHSTHSNTHVPSSVFVTAPASEAKSSILVMRNEALHTEPPSIDDPFSRSRDSDDSEFVDKFVAFESSEKEKHQRGDGGKSGVGNAHDKVEVYEPGRINVNENTMISVVCQSNICEHVHPKGEHDVFHHHADHSLSNVNDLHSKYPEASTEGSGHHLELMGCYMHPMPVLSIMLNTKNNSSLQVYVLCGFLESCQRFLYVYNITPEDQEETPPSFVGYTPLLLPSLEQSSTGNFTFERSGLQITPDGRLLVLLSSIRIPCCSVQSMDCSCSMCELDQCDDNSLKVVSINFGYTSFRTKLMPNGTVSCLLIFEPNYVVAAEDSRNLHVWMMADGWSVICEENVITSLGNVGPSILELRRMPKSSSLIIGHDGAGGFCLWHGVGKLMPSPMPRILAQREYYFLMSMWLKEVSNIPRDISKRTLLSTFAAPGNIVFQIVPLGFCSLQEDIVQASVEDIERRLRAIAVSDMSKKTDKECALMSPGIDLAIWVMVSSASVAEYQHDLRAKEHNGRWRLALLAKRKVFMGNIFDPRVTTVDACGNYGYAGTNGGLLYMWELSSGRKLDGTQCLECGRVSCIAVDDKSSIVAVADDGCQLSLYTQSKV